MKYIDIINYSNKKLDKKKLEKNIGFKILFFVDKTIKNINDFTIKRSQKISPIKMLFFKFYLFQYITLKKPLQYIMKESYFFNNDFILLKKVHSPKIESEILVNKAIELIRLNNYHDILDLCCGSGVLGISILLNENVNLFLSDIDKKAIKNTNLNLQKYNLNASVIKSNLFNNIDKKFDLIICNPPYISYNDKDIEKSVKKYENKKALFANNNGLYFFEKIIENINEKLNKNGTIIFEIGYNQLDSLLPIIKRNKKVKKIESIKDQWNHNRAIVVYF